MARGPPRETCSVWSRLDCLNPRGSAQIRRGPHRPLEVRSIGKEIAPTIAARMMGSGNMPRAPWYTQARSRPVKDVMISERGT